MDVQLLALELRASADCIRNVVNRLKHLQRIDAVVLTPGRVSGEFVLATGLDVADALEQLAIRREGLP
jgi:hypothetical protein